MMVVPRATTMVVLWVASKADLLENMMADRMVDHWVGPWDVLMVVLWEPPMAVQMVDSLAVLSAMMMVGYLAGRMVALMAAR